MAKQFIFDQFYSSSNISSAKQTTKQPIERSTDTSIAPIKEIKKQELSPATQTKEKPIKIVRSEDNTSAKKHSEVVNKDVVKTIKKEKQTDATPMLAIIIDDVSTKDHVNKIQNIGFPITMAFMPPTERHKDSAKIAQDIPLYMVHLPLEGSTRTHEETNTLYVGDSLQKIDDRIKQIRKLYPHARYTNNHTGSKFTEDNDSMDKLMQILKKYNFVFIDSKTTPKSVAQKYAQKYGFRYIARDVFLDNVQTKEAISSELKRAIKIASKNGSAITIGHPHNVTLQTLKDSKNILNDLNIVLIDKI